MEEFVKSYIKMSHEVKVSDEVTEQVLRYGRSSLFWTMVKKFANKKTHKHYYYLITFTLKGDINPADWDIIEQFISSQATRPALRIIEWHQSRELTKKGVAHWHCAVKSENIICKDRFNTYLKRYGNIDISPTKSKTLTEGLNYINKDSSSVRIV